MKGLRAFLPLLVLIAVGIALLASGALERFSPQHIAQEQADLQASIALHPLLAALTQIGLMAMSIATGIPGAIVIVLAGGMLFGIVTGTILSSIGTTIGALILFLASRSAFQHGTRQVPALVERLRSGYHAHPVSYALFLRLVPFFPFGGVTVALAWLRCPLWLFALATATGGTVMVAFETALGAGLTQAIARDGAFSMSIFAHKHVLLPLLGMAVLALTPIVLSQLRRKK
ncbi:MAG: VTT domain-containing protein [Dokdonella sp.]